MKKLYYYVQFTNGYNRGMIFALDEVDVKENIESFCKYIGHEQLVFIHTATSSQELENILEKEGIVTEEDEETVY